MNQSPFKDSKKPKLATPTFLSYSHKIVGRISVIFLLKKSTNKSRSTKLGLLFSVVLPELRIL